MTSVAQTNAVDINIDTSTLHLSQRGKITGVISMRVGDDYFPERLWSDFPVVILGWWLSRMLEVWHGHTEQAVCRFMDGDFHYELTKVEDGLWRLGCVEGDVGTGYIIQADVNPLMFIRQTLNRATTVFEACRSKKWCTNELDVLETIIGRLTDQKLELKPTGTS